MLDEIIQSNDEDPEMNEIKSSAEMMEEAK